MDSLLWELFQDWACLRIRALIQVNIAGAISEPEAQARCKAHLVGRAAGGADEIRRAAKLAVVGHADVRRQLAGDLVAQSQAGIDFGKPAADLARRIVLGIEVHLDLRLQDQPLRDEKVVAAFELGGEMAVATDIAGGGDAKEQRRQTLDAERAPAAPGP